MSDFLILNRLSWYWRLPAKWAAFAIVAGLVCFPYPTLLARHVQHWRNPDALIEPNAPALAPLASELRARVPAGLPPKDALRHVQTFVLEKVPYDWDWNTWGLADYLPTVAEVLEQGREDCDGRAVIAASLLETLGYEARLVTDFSHVWVRTQHGDLMGPGKRTAVTATDKGLNVTLRGLAELPRALAYGMAVFPAQREMIILVAAWLLMLGPRARFGRAALSLSVMTAGLFLLRSGGSAYLKPVIWMQVLGFACVVAAVLCLLVPAGVARRPTMLEEPGDSYRAATVRERLAP